MTGFTIDRSFGRVAFGLDPAGYHSARPQYPEWVLAALVEQCGLAEGRSVFEIGSGPGTITRPLLDLGAGPLIAIEPDPRSAAFLREHNPDTALQVVVSTFEAIELEESAFDLGVCATAFHWLEEDAALAKVARILRPGGWWAMVWNEFGDENRPDLFHEATNGLLGEPIGPSAGTGGISFALDNTARVEALERVGAFDVIEHRTSAWLLELDAEQTVALYATFSNINAREDRQMVLAEVKRIARDEFQNHVTRNMITSLYVARKRH